VTPRLGPTSRRLDDEEGAEERTTRDNTGPTEPRKPTFGQQYYRPRKLDDPAKRQPPPYSGKHPSRVSHPGFGQQLRVSRPTESAKRQRPIKPSRVRVILPTPTPKEAGTQLQPPGRRRSRGPPNGRVTPGRIFHPGSATTATSDASPIKSATPPSRAKCTTETRTGRARQVATW
jgi:hypothetical protein